MKYTSSFIIPMDHPLGDDTQRLSRIGIQQFVDQIDHLEHDGYIFHARQFFSQPVDTSKEFFLTVGEKSDEYVCDISVLKNQFQTKLVTIFFELHSVDDSSVFDFYKEYVRQLKQNNFFVMAMGFPAEEVVFDGGLNEAGVSEVDFYQAIVDTVVRLGCDAFKTDLFDGIKQLNLEGMPLFIGGGPYLNDFDFNKFINQVVTIPDVNCSFGRNIFEADNYEQRIKSVLAKLKQESIK